MRADVTVLAGLELASLQALPEPLIGHAVPLLHRDKNRVGSSADVGETVSCDRKEILVGGYDRAIHLELDHGEGAIERGEGRRDFVGLRRKHQHAFPVINSGPGPSNCEPSAAHSAPTWLGKTKF